MMKTQESNFNFKYKVTLLDFLRLFNFNYYDDSCKSEDNKCNTNTLRVVLSTKTYTWFEIGVYNYDGVGNTIDRLQTIIKEEILNKYVADISYNDDVGVLEVFITDEKEFID